MSDIPAHPLNALKLVRLPSQEAVRRAIRECEGKHPQQVAYSTFHDALTQVCYGCGTVRTNIGVGA